MFSFVYFVVTRSAQLALQELEYALLHMLLKFDYADRFVAILVQTAHPQIVQRSDKVARGLHEARVSALDRAFVLNSQPLL